MSEGQVRELLEVLRSKTQGKYTNVIQVAALSGGVSALEMVLEESE